MNKDNPTLQDLLERDEQKLDAMERARESSKVQPEEMLLAEFGLYYGFEAVLAALENRITDKQMNDLVLGARRINSQKRYNELVDRYMSAIATQSKKGVSEFKKHLRELSKSWQ